MNLEKSKPKLISVSGTCKYCHQMRVTKVREVLRVRLMRLFPVSVAVPER